MASVNKKFYTISTLILATRKEAEAKFLEWDEDGDLRPGSLLIEVEKGKVLEPQRSFKFTEHKQPKIFTEFSKAKHIKKHGHK